MSKKNLFPIFNIFLSLTIFIFISFQAKAGLIFTYNELAKKNEESMMKFVDDKLKESKKSYAGKSVPLKEALQAIYSRPDSDLILSKVITPIQSELEKEKAYEKSVKDLVKEAVNALKNSRAFHPKVQATYLMFLTNLVGNLKSHLSEGEFNKEIIKKIAEAKVEPTPAAISEIKKQLQIEMKSPSDLASAALTAPSQEGSTASAPSTSQETPKTSR